jgi:hypothetical protein
VEVLEEFYHQQEHLEQIRYLVASPLPVVAAAQQKLAAAQVAQVVREEAAPEMRPAPQAILLLLLHLKVIMAAVAVPAQPVVVEVVAQVVLEVQHQELVPTLVMVVLVGQAQTVQ